jgi:hypothetical protein
MKLSKRAFVKGTAAVALVATGTSAWRSDSPRAKRALPDGVVYNDLYPQACAFAASFAVHSVRAFAVEGDAGRLWYGTLRMLIDAGARHIVGMTTHTDLLILETLARDKGLRPSQRDCAGRLVSWVLI